MRNRDLKESTTTTSTTTTNYDLPQWNGEDVTSWLVNLNDAFNKIDSAMWANHTAMAGYDKIASDLQKLADSLRVDNSEIRESLEIIQRGMAQQLAELNQAKQAITNANIAITQLQQKDNVLSAMVKDLQDDVGMMMNWRKWKAHAPYPTIRGTVTGADGATCNWEFVSLSICNGMIQFNTRLIDALSVEGGHTTSLELTTDESSKITAWIAENYPPAQGEFGIAGMHNILHWGLVYTGAFLHEITTGERRWRISIRAMKSGTIPAGQLIVTKGMVGGYET